MPVVRTGVRLVIHAKGSNLAGLHYFSEPEINPLGNLARRETGRVAIRCQPSLRYSEPVCRAEVRLRGTDLVEFNVFKTATEQAAGQNAGAT